MITRHRNASLTHVIGLTLILTGAQSVVASGQAAEQAGDKSFLADWLDGVKLPDTVQVHGFVSQGYLYSTGNNFFGRSTDTGSLDFNESGINGSWRPREDLQASMQVVYRRAGRTDNSDLRIDFGFLDYTFYTDDDAHAGVRAGRVFNPYGLYNDTRDMPFTRPSILLPQSIYFDVNRNASLSGDGVQLYAEQRTPIGDFSIQFNGFYQRTGDPDLRYSVSLDTAGRPRAGHLNGLPSWTGRLVYDWDNGRLRLAVTSTEFNAEFVPSHRGKTTSSTFSPTIFSIQYNSENWSLTSEYAIRPLATKNPLGEPGRVSSIGESYYVQGTYRILDDLEALVRYDVVYPDREDQSGKRFSAVSGQPAYERQAKDFTIGLRYDITSSIMLRAEYHRISGSYWVSDLENPNGTKEDWNLFVISTAFRF